MMQSADIFRRCYPMLKSAPTRLSFAPGSSLLTILTFQVKPPLRLLPKKKTQSQIAAAPFTDLRPNRTSLPIAWGSFAGAGLLPAVVPPAPTPFLACCCLPASRGPTDLPPPTRSRIFFNLLPKSSSRSGRRAMASGFGLTVPGGGVAVGFAVGGNGVRRIGTILVAGLIVCLPTAANRRAVVFRQVENVGRVVWMENRIGPGAPRYGHPRTDLKRGAAEAASGKSRPPLNHTARCAGAIRAPCSGA